MGWRVLFVESNDTRFHAFAKATDCELGSIGNLRPDKVVPMHGVHFVEPRGASPVVRGGALHEAHA
jgi:hypothetical protein